MYSNTNINDNFNRIFSILNNVRQTQNIILDNLYDLNQNHSQTNLFRPNLGSYSSRNPLNTNPFNTNPFYTNPFNTNPVNTNPFNRAPMNFTNQTSQTNQRNQTQTTSNTQPSFTDGATNVEISFVDPRNSENTLLAGIFNNLFGQVNNSTDLTFTEILNNTEIDLNTTQIDEMCTICRAHMEENAIIKKIKKCNHCFHQICLDNWLKNHTTCPNCRQDIRQNDTDDEVETTEQSTVDL